MSKNKLPRLSEAHRQAVLATLTRDRLWKYLKACGNDEHMSLRLYVLNTKVSAAFLMDLHYVEVALRNKFDGVLTVAYTDQWFTDPGFLTHLKPAGLQNLTKAQSAANKGRPQGTPVPRGKVIAELTFGFWLTLTDRHLEVPLWTPCLHKVFHNGRPPKRSKFNGMLETLRILRNRIAHHEPIFHMDLREAHRVLNDVAHMLCPTTAHVMNATSTAKRDMMALTRFQTQRGL